MKARNKSIPRSNKNAIRSRINYKMRATNCDFSLIEDGNDASVMIGKIADAAGRSAVAEAKAKKISRTYIRKNNELVTITANGKEIILEPKTKTGRFFITYKPLTVFNVVGK